MAKKLEEYDKKRDFEGTPEPKGSKPAAAVDNPRFVIQEHSATRLHWDLRLEHDGVLLSWAIPNGIPQDPKENRKAVHTEDHPLEYLDFHGEIPKGNYGAGTMTIWDRGTYEAEKIRDGEVIAVFHGERTEGRYALFRTGPDDKDWMIHRMDPPADPEAEPMPDHVVPMLARGGALPEDESEWGFEVKWDGMRALVYSKPGRMRIDGRNLQDITARWPELSRLNRALHAHEAVLDGEIVAFDEEGKPSFQRLQRRMNVSDAQAKRLAKSIPATFVAFDLLWLDGHSLMDQPYSERRARLEELDLNGERWRTPPSYAGDGKPLLAATAAQGLEGIVAKRLDSRYEPGHRSPCWIKVKHKQTERFVVGGWLPGERPIGAVLLGRRDEEGKLRYAGRAGSGLTDAAIESLEQRLKPRERSPFTGTPRPPRGAKFCRPELEAEVEFSDWTQEGVVRHPVFKGVVESDLPFPVSELPKGALEAEVDGRTLRLSNFDKVLYPKAGFTKGDMIRYYAEIAEVLVPHLHGRPLTLKRYPNGVDGEYFYEKQCPQHRPDWVQTAAVYSRRNDADINFCLANDRATLVWTANLADIELHTSLSLADPIERPTMMVFDLDPGPGTDIVECCRVALWVREIFAPLGLEMFPKTSGSKGLQVYVPLNSDVTYEDTKPFAKAVAELLEKQHPELVVSRMSKDLRPGKVLVDWSQNDEHKTTVNVYSLRAKDRPTVSTPVTWDEVAACSDAADLRFEQDEVLNRVQRDGDLFAPVLTLVQELPRF
jgi:bifunctional non-homologous end joining protein LigD